MVNKYNSASGTLLLQSDLAARKPIYIYFSEKKNKLLYSESLVALLDSNEVQKPLAVSHEGVSFLLQSGVVPPPKTVYENIYIVGIGDEAEISNFNGSISLKFRHNFPFLQSKRETGVSYEVSFDQILNKLFDATVKEIDKSKETFVFHSAGKDSNPIVLSIAEAGLQDQFTLVTHKSEKKGDESEISKSIADRLGFRHEVLSEVEIFEQKHLMCIDKHYRNSPLPCTDNVSIAYPLYVAQQPSLQDCNIIDGMGSDVYIGHVPSAIEYKRQKLSNVFSFFRSISSYVSSTINLLPLTRTRAEWTGLSGFYYKY